MKIKELGHVVLYVTDLEKSVKFYRDILGFNSIGDINLGSSSAVAFSSGRTHHELLLIGIGGESPKHKEIKPGLYHIGLKVGDKPEDLRKAKKEIENAGVEIIGASDHTVTHGLYILDPDKNEIELYVDVSDEWKKDPSLVLAPIKPLDLD